MIKPYTAVGLIPTVRGIRRRKDIKLNLEHLKHLVKAASWLSSLDLPVRLIAFPEGALQAFNDEVLDLDHATFARECAIDIPGEETDELGKIAKEYNAFVMAQAKAKHPDLKDRFFNVGFIINPRGKVILKHYKVSPLFPVEHSVCPHDVYDWWVEKYGRTLDAFWPVADTEIGRLGIMMANEGSYPENARALAMNGAEVVYRASYPHPATGNEIFEIQSRARALDNNMYIVAPNMGTYYLFPEETTPIDTFGGRSFVIALSLLAGFSAYEIFHTTAVYTALVVLAASNDVVSRSAANLPWAKTILAHNLNLYDLFTHDHVVIAKDALELIEETFA